jgi:acyl carrier protein
MSLEEVIRRLIARNSRADGNGISMSSRLDEIGVEPLGVAQIVIYLEARFGISIDSREALRWTTGDEMVATVEHLLAERHRDAG